MTEDDDYGAQKINNRKCERLSSSTSQQKDHDVKLSAPQSSFRRV